MTPGALYDALDDAIEAVGAGRWLHPRRAVLWLSAPQVVIDGHVWHARRHDATGHGYSLSQARQMRDALIPVMADYLALLPPIADAIRHDPETPGPPR